MSKKYNAIVVGARCAGSPTAMLLARQGYRVLMVDRATFPSDTVSTHIVHPNGVRALSRWSLLDRLTATGCPPIHTYSFDFGPFTLAGSPGTPEAPLAYCPRRTILDKLLVDAAAESGVEVREGFSVERVVIEDGRVVGIEGRSKQGGSIVDRAEVVVGADGRRSVVAEAVRPGQYDDKPPLLAGYYTYWSGLPMRGRFEQYVRERRGFAAAATMKIRRWSLRAGHMRSSPRTRRISRGITSRRSNWRQILPIAYAVPGRKRALQAQRAELFPQALRPRLGARRRCRLQQRLHHRARDHGRLPGRRALRHRTLGDIFRNAVVRGCDERLSSRSRRNGKGDVRIHLPARDPGAATTGDAAALGCDPWQQGGYGRVCTAKRRNDISCGVLWAGKRPRDHGSGSLTRSVISCRSPDRRWLRRTACRTVSLPALPLLPPAVSRDHCRSGGAECALAWE